MPAITFLPLVAATVALDSITFLMPAGLMTATVALDLARQPGTTTSHKAVAVTTHKAVAGPTVPGIAGFEDSTVINP